MGCCSAPAAGDEEAVHGREGAARVTGSLGGALAEPSLNNRPLLGAALALPDYSAAATCTYGESAVDTTQPPQGLKSWRDLSAPSPAPAVARSPAPRQRPASAPPPLPRAPRAPPLPPPARARRKRSHSAPPSVRAPPIPVRAGQQRQQQQQQQPQLPAGAPAPVGRGAVLPRPLSRLPSSTLRRRRSSASLPGGGPARANWDCYLGLQRSASFAAQLSPPHRRGSGGPAPGPDLGASRGAPHQPSFASIAAAWTGMAPAPQSPRLPPEPPGLLQPQLPAADGRALLDLMRSGQGHTALGEVPPFWEAMRRANSEMAPRFIATSEYLPPEAGALWASSAGH
eukprot:TRINITY_DN18374_c0_g1_i1.p1 TRINITY_DN18374_c0_g1~~TRINITY_DN18374_c0_g1_i1.p1  ORF type:complete len:369 (+),score=96.76 TRINITY_DN18374_c0_g1_i1:86-1108(+)